MRNSPLRPLSSICIVEHMKTILVTIILTLALNAFAADNVTKKLTIENYRKQYSSLVVKWEKTNDATKRKVIEKQMDTLKAENLHLFAKQ